MFGHEAELRERRTDYWQGEVDALDECDDYVDS